MHQQMVLTCVREKKYKTATLIHAFECFALSWRAYRRMREDFELPSITELTRLASKIKALDDGLYERCFFPVRNGVC